MGLAAITEMKSTKGRAVLEESSLSSEIFMEDYSDTE
jgi:hypothetical protein